MKLPVEAHYWVPRSVRRAFRRALWIDLFPKLQEDIKIRRPTSGLLSVFYFVLMGWLMYTELSNYVSDEWRSAVGVDLTGSEEKLLINVDVTVPGMPCGDFGMDVVDVAGLLQLGFEEKLDLRPEDRGCRVVGQLEATKVDGEFHIAFGRLARKSYGQGDKLTAAQTHATAHVHQFSLAEIKWFNSSHHINHISFGHPHPDEVDVEHPLDGICKLVEKDLARYTYYIKVIPTVYYFTDGSTISTYRLSFTEFQKAIVASRTFKQPGVFWKYEISPYQVTYTQVAHSLPHTIARLCAIVGGLFVIFGLVSNLISGSIDRFWHYVEAAVDKRREDYPRVSK